MVNESHSFAPEGGRILFVTFLLSLVGFYFSWLIGLTFFFFFGFSLYFFRNPKRNTPSAGLISPADGKVIFIGEKTEPHFLKKPMQRVTVFMSPVDVHINRVPENGEVLNSVHHHGKFMAAFAENASEENERLANHIRTENGDEIVFVQIAGWFARRIISYLQVGQKVQRGQIFGLIKFGSRMDVYFPQDYEIAVQMNQMVKAGETVLANKKASV